MKGNGSIHFFKIILAGMLIPAFVFAQTPASENVDEEIQILEEQLRFRKKIEADSFAITTRLCDVFNIRKKYQMGLRPDPISEIWIRMAYLTTAEAVAYRRSLFEWLKVGHQGALVNWGLEDNSIDSNDSMVVMVNSRFTKTLIVTKGFHEAAKNCGDLNEEKLIEFLYEQELAQTGVTYVAVPLIALRGMMLSGSFVWPALRTTSFGIAATKLPWSTIKKTAIVSFAAYIGYAFYHDTVLKDKSNHSNAAEVTKLKISQQFLLDWYKNKEAKNLAFKKAEDYLLKNKAYLQDLLQQYEKELNLEGAKRILEITERFLKNNGKLDDERDNDIFMKSVTYANLQLFLSEYP